MLPASPHPLLQDTQPSELPPALVLVRVWGCALFMGLWACREAEQSPPGEPGASIPHPCTPPSLEVVLHVVLLFALSLTQTSSEKPLTPQQGRGRSLQKRLHPAPKRTISITLFLFSLSFFLSLSPPLSLSFFFPWTLKI